jgi:hypothetical protein
VNADHAELVPRRRVLQAGFYFIKAAGTGDLTKDHQGSPF